MNQLRWQIKEKRTLLNRNQLHYFMKHIEEFSEFFKSAAFLIGIYNEYLLNF